MGYDIGNYRHDASFSYEVYPGITQVPVHTLGKSRYTNEQMEKISRLPAAEKRPLIGNLYEAIQLFQLSGFAGILDNTDYWLGGVHWQTHTPPELAVTRNKGCCATDTNWLAYFLKDRYDFIGSFCFGSPDQNGHITTCIQHHGQFYLIDMMMCRLDSQAFSDSEDTPPLQRKKSGWEGYLYRCEDLAQMCRFYIERFRASGRLAPYCFYLREGDHVTATGVSQDENGIVTFYAPQCDRPRLLYCDPALGHRFAVVPLPELSVGQTANCAPEPVQ